MLATGSVLTGLGLIIVGGGIGGLVSAERHKAMEDPYESHEFPGPPGALAGAILVPVGAVIVAVGVPLLAVGVHRERAWRRWKQGVVTRLRPGLGRDAYGTWVPGLALRF
jgi:hypothetical protein